MSQPKCILISSEKSGSGKTNLAIHLTMGLLSQGKPVFTIDLDETQAAFSKFVYNRRSNGSIIKLNNLNKYHLSLSNLPPHERDYSKIDQIISTKKNENFYVIIDTASHDFDIEKFGAFEIDTIITPANESYLDLSFLVNIDPITKKIISPSTYSEKLWEYKKKKNLYNKRATKKHLNWYLLLNKAINDNSSKKIAKIFKEISIRYNCFPFYGKITPYVNEDDLFTGKTSFDTHETELTLKDITLKQNIRMMIKHLL